MRKTAADRANIDINTVDQPRILRTEAITLRSIDYGETSTIATLYTREMGTATVLAKGARLPASRYGSTLQPMSYIQTVFGYKPTREIQILRESSHVLALTDISRSLDKLEVGFRIVELTRHLFRESEPNPQAFNLLLQVLVHLDNARVRFNNLLLFYQIRVASILGFAPVFERYLLDSLPESGGVLSLENGTISGDPVEGGRKATRNALRAFAIFCRADISSALRLRLSPADWLEVAELTDAYLRRHISDHMPHRTGDVFARIARQSR